MFCKSVEDFVAETITGECNDHIIVRRDLFRELLRMPLVCGDCGWYRDCQNTSVELGSLDRLTGYVQGAFAVVEDGFDDVIENLHAPTL